VHVSRIAVNVRNMSLRMRVRVGSFLDNQGSAYAQQHFI